MKFTNVSRRKRLDRYSSTIMFIYVSFFLLATVLGMSGCASHHQQDNPIESTSNDNKTTIAESEKFPQAIKLSFVISGYKIVEGRIADNTTLGCIESLSFLPNDFFLDPRGVVIKITPNSARCDLNGRYYLLDIPSIKNGTIQRLARLVEPADLQHVPPPRDEIQVEVDVREGVIVSNRIIDTNAWTEGLNVSTVTDTIPKAIKIQSKYYPQEEWWARLPTQNGLSIIIAKRRGYN